MSALPASSAESRTTTQPSSASSTPQTSQTPISGDKTSSKSNSRLPILTDADVFAAQNQFPPTSCLQNAVLTAELVSRSSEAALEEIHSAGSRTKIKIPTPNLPLQALHSKTLCPSNPHLQGAFLLQDFLLHQQQRETAIQLSFPLSRTSLLP